MGHECEFMLQVGTSRFDLNIEIMTLCVMIFLVCIAFLISGSLKKVPHSKIQNIIEMIVEFLNKLAVDMIGPQGKKYVPLSGSIFLFVLISNWMGLLPGNIFIWLTDIIPSREIEFSLFNTLCSLKWTGIQITPPTGNLNTPLALALVSLFYYNYCGIRETGLKKYLIHHLGPIPELARSFTWPLSILLVPLTVLFVFLNMIEHISRTFSLTVRLFCNIMGEHSVIAALVAVVVQFGIAGLFIIPIPLIVMLIGTLTGAVQALIFALLTFSYISAFVAEHH